MIFWIFAGILFVATVWALYIDDPGSGWGALVGFSLMISLIWWGGYLPSLEWYYGIVYLFCTGTWMAIYWFMKIWKVKMRLQSVIKNGSMVGKSPLESIKERYGRCSDYVDGDKIVIPDPSKDDIIANGILFPISIPMFILEDSVEQLYYVIKSRITQIKLGFMAKLNKMQEEFNEEKV